MTQEISIEYANAYAEVLEVLNHMVEEDYNKVPKIMIEMFKANSNKEYQFTYDDEKEFEEQNLSKRAKLILAILFRDYWATPTQKEKIIAKQKHDRAKIEEEKKEKYNYDNLFKDKASNQKTETIEETKSLVEYKESIWNKLIRKIKNIFSKK